MVAHIVFNVAQHLLKIIETNTQVAKSISFVAIFYGFALGLWETIRGMHSQEDIQQMASRIKAGLGCRVFVFGPYAWGRLNACSDVDLAVVLPDDSGVKQATRVAARLSQHGLIPIDVIALKETALAQADSGTLAYETRTRGVELSVLTSPKSGYGRRIEIFYWPPK